MEHDAEERTPSKTSKGPKVPVSAGEETAPTRTAKHTGRGHKRDAKTPRHTAGSNKEEAMPKERDHGRKTATMKRRGSSKNRETGSTTTKLKTAAAAEAPPIPGTASYPERAASTAAETSDHQRNEPGDDRIQASRGADETNVPPGDPSVAASANADMSGSLPPAGGSGKDNTRPDSSSETKAAVPAESNSGNVGTAVPTQQATSLASEKEQATRIIRDKVASKQEAMPAKTAVPDAEVAATRRKFRHARWITRMSTAKATGNPSESRNLSPHIAKRIPASWNAVLLFVSLVLLTLAAYLMFRKDSKKVYYDTCKTLACEEFSRRLLDSINRSVSPCVSFDHYVCDGWRATHDLSVREDSFQSILGRLYRNVRDMDVPKRGQDDKQRAAAFYRSCECVGKGDCDELPIVLRALKDAGVPWPHRAPKRIRVLKTMLFTSVNLRWGGILAFEFSRGPGERRVFLRLAEEFNLLKWKWDEHRLSPGSRERYFEVLRDRYAGAGSSSATKKTSAALVTYEETQQVESVMLQKLFQIVPATVTTLGADIMYNTVPGLTETLWESALGLYFARLKATGAVVFHTDAGNLVQQLLEMWRDHGERAFHLLLSWCAVQLAALYANQQLIDNFYGSRGKAEVAHGVSCFSKAFRIVGEQILDGVGAQFLPQKMMPTAVDMTTGVRKAFHRRLQRWKYYDDNVTVVYDWNSTAVVLKYFDGSVENASDNTLHIGDKQVQRIAKMDMSDSLVNNWAVAAIASFVDTGSLRLSEDIEDLDMYTLVQSDAQSPDFTLLPYAFAFPYFEEGATRALNYAGVANHMAEALSLLFLEAYDTQLKSTAALTDYFVCMEGNASDILGRRGWARHMEPVTLKVALDAYRSADGAESGDRRLEGLEFLSPEQLFYVAACFTRCVGSATISARRGEALCDAAFRHVDEFADAFGCVVGSPLNPEKKCLLL